MSRQSSLLRDDMETGNGYLLAGGGSSSDQSLSASSIKDALWSTRARKAVTICSALTIFVLFIALIAVASKSPSSSSSPSTPTYVAPSGIYPTQYVQTFMRYPGQPETTAAAMPVNLTIGFIADTMITEDTNKLYRQLVADGAEVIVVSGDLDYIDFADGWDQLITNTLGSSFPMLVAAGNHDEAVWPDYQAHIIRRWQNAAITHCDGVVGVMHTCTWKGVTIVQIAPGVFNDSDSKWRTVPGLGDLDFVSYINDAFTKYPSPWRICSWHKNQHLMQTGDKSDETGWGVYNTCQQWGAMIMTGHEHSYERTYQMLSLQSQTVKTTANPSKLTLSPTDAIVVVQGLGGRGVRVDKAGPSEGWWAVRDNADTKATFSANICKYNVNGNAKQAYCYGKDINRKIIDQYWITLP